MIKYHVAGSFTILLICFFLFVALVPDFSWARSVSQTGDESVQFYDTTPNQTINSFLPNMMQGYTKDDLDPGVPPEGDYLGSVTFTRDGSRILLTNRLTDNVTVFDWASMAVLANITVGDYPGAVAVSDSYAVVACAFSDEIYIIDLDDYAIDTVFTLAAGQQPWVVRISPDQARAYVACDISNTCEVFDLITLNHTLTISNFPISLVTAGWTSENGRNFFKFSDFVVSPDNNELIVPDGQDSLFFFNAINGTIEDTITGIENCYVVGLSRDGAKAVTLSAGSQTKVSQIDLTTHSITGSVTIPLMLMTYEVGVNYDGSKALVGVSGNQNAIVRFATSDYTLISSTYTAFWIGTSPDQTLAISGQYRFSIIDFATEAVLGQYIGNSQYSGAASPVDSHVASFDPYTHEGIYFYDYSTPSAPNYRGTTNSGFDPEGDAPRRVAITPDGKKAVVTNVLSDNAAIVNLETYAVDTLISIGDRVQDVAITSDSRYAVVCGFNSNSAFILDLDSNEVVANVPTGTRSSVVSISSDDHYAYVGNVLSNTVTVIELAGALSQPIAEIPCGEIGVVWAAYGVSSDVKVNPAGEYALVAVSFDDQVKIIDTLTNAVVATLTVGDFPIQIAFNDSGDYAIIANYFDDAHSVIYVDGAASSVVGSFTYGDGPLRLAYNQALDEIGIGYFNDKKIVNIDPETGVSISTNYYNSYGNLIQVLFDENGEPLVLTTGVGLIPGHLHRGTESIELPAAPSYFDYCPAVQKAVVTMPGPDYISVVDWDTLGSEEMVTIPLSREAVLYDPRPNPFTKSSKIEFYLSQSRNVEVCIYDAAGKKVRDLMHQRLGQGQHVLFWNCRDEKGNEMEAGVYFVTLNADQLNAVEKIIYCK